MIKIFHRDGLFYLFYCRIHFIQILLYNMQQLFTLFSLCLFFILLITIHFLLVYLFSLQFGIYTYMLQQVVAGKRRWKGELSYVSPCFYSHSLILLNFPLPPGFTAGHGKWWVGGGEGRESGVNGGWAVGGLVGNG